jgi:hypothetical protein
MNLLKPSQFPSLLQRFSSNIGWLAATCLASVAGTVQADLADVNFYNNISYMQTSAAAPVTPFGYFANIGGDFQTAGDFDSVTASYPGAGSPQTLAIKGTNFNFGSQYDATQNAQQTDFPYGVYTVTASNSVTNTVQNGTINYSADYFTSAIPALTANSFNGLSGMNPTNGYTVAFNAFTPDPNVSVGLTFFSIFDASNNLVFTSGGLSAAATSVYIPLNTLLVNSAYTFELDFTDRIIGYDAVNNVNTLQGFDVRTDGAFTTAAAVPLPAAFWLFGSALTGFVVTKKRRFA